LGGAALQRLLKNTVLKRGFATTPLSVLKVLDNPTKLKHHSPNSVPFRPEEDKNAAKWGN
jgi:hypothetical protein